MGNIGSAVGVFAHRSCHRCPKSRPKGPFPDTKESAEIRILWYSGPNHVRKGSEIPMDRAARLKCDFLKTAKNCGVFDVFGGWDLPRASQVNQVDAKFGEICVV